MKFHVRGLSYRSTNDGLATVFENMGYVVKDICRGEKRSGCPSETAIVEVEDDDVCADEVIERLMDAELDWRRLVVSKVLKG